MTPDAIVPRPDPTAATTDALDRAIGNLRDQIDARLNAMDKAVTLFHDDLTRVPTEVDRQILHLREFLLSKIDMQASVRAEQLKGIDTQFTERDKRTEQLSIASATAIAAALQAAKEAVGAQNASSALAISKSEASTAKNIEQLQTLFQSDSRAINEKIDDVKSRLDRGEGGTAGATGRSAAIAMIVMAAVAIGSLAVAILSFIRH